MTQRSKLAILVVCLGSFMAGLDLFIVNVAFPDIGRDFPGSGLGALSWVLNAYTIVFAALLVPAGRWADALGRRRVFLAGLGVFTAASAACAATGSVELLVALRVAQAAGAALLLPTSLALLLTEFPAERRALVVAAWAAVSGIAAAAGPPVGGLLVELSWRWVFIVNVPIGLVAIVLGARVLREARDPASTRPDAFGAVLLAAGVAALIGGIVEGPDWGWADVRVLLGFGAAAALIAVVARRCARHPAPVVDPALLRVRSFALALAGAVLFFAAFGAMLLASVLLLTGPWGEDILHAGLGIAPGPAMAAVVSLPGARLAQRLGMGTVGALGAALFIAGGLWWVTQVGPAPDYAGAFLPGMLVGGAGVGLVIPTITGAATAALPPARLATGTAVVTMGRQLGMAIGVAVLVALLGAGASVDDFDAPYAFMIATAAVSGVVLAAIGRAGARVPEPVTT